MPNSHAFTRQVFTLKLAYPWFTTKKLYLKFYLIIKASPTALDYNNMKVVGQIWESALCRGCWSFAGNTYLSQGRQAPPLPNCLHLLYHLSSLVKDRSLNIRKMSVCIPLACYTCQQTTLMSPVMPRISRAMGNENWRNICSFSLPWYGALMSSSSCFSPTGHFLLPPGQKRKKKDWIILAGYSQWIILTGSSN